MERFNGKIRKPGKDRIFLTAFVCGLLYLGVASTHQQSDEVNSSVRRFLEDEVKSHPEVVDSNRKASQWVSGAMIGLPM